MSDFLSIRESASYLGNSEMYVRKLITSGVLKAEKEALIGKTWRHVISRAELDAFKARVSNRSSRDDGRNKFVIYLTKTEESKLREMLTKSDLKGLNSLLNRANPSK